MFVKTPLNYKYKVFPFFQGCMAYRLKNLNYISHPFLHSENYFRFVGKVPIEKKRADFPEFEHL